MTITRRQLAHGTLWSAPVILASAAAPAMAVSPCALYKLGGALPASAFTLTYMYVNREILGAIFDKQIVLEFGFRISDEARACGVRNTTFTSANGSGVSRARLANNTWYTLTTNETVTANGRAGTVNTLCRFGASSTEACNAAVPEILYTLVGSGGTYPNGVAEISLQRTITVAGYAPTNVIFNASFSSAGLAPRTGTNLRVTAGG